MMYDVMKFALTDLLDEAACYEYLLQALHPEGLACPHGHPLPPTARPSASFAPPGPGREIQMWRPFKSGG
jgi:hypothetical protein